MSDGPIEPREDLALLSRHYSNEMKSAYTLQGLSVLDHDNRFYGHLFHSADKHECIWIYEMYFLSKPTSRRMIVGCCGICVKKNLIKSKHEGSSHGLSAGSFHAHQLVQ